MKIKDYKIGDIYMSSSGIPYRVVSVCEEPSIIFYNIGTGNVFSKSMSEAKFDGLKLVWKSPKEDKLNINQSRVG